MDGAGLPAAMFPIWLNSIRLLVVAGAVCVYAVSTARLALPEWLAGSMSLALGAGAVSVLWIVLEVLSHNAPPDDLDARLAAAHDGRTLPKPGPATGGAAGAGGREREPDREEFLRRVQKLAAGEQFEQLARELPRAAVLEPMLQTIPAAERPRVLIAIARAHEAAKDYDTALLRAGQARALKPDSAMAREIVCRVAAANSAEKFRVDDLYPVFKELAAGWKEEYAPLVLHALRAGLARASMTPRAVAQIWDLLQPFRKFDEVTEPFVTELEAHVRQLPERADLLAIVARLRAAQGDGPAALKAAGEATAHTIDCPSVYKFLLEHHASAGKLGELALALQKLAAAGVVKPALENARREVDEAIRTAADSAAKRAEASASPLELGMGHLSRGDYPKAITCLQKAIQKAPSEQTSFIRFLLARSFLKEKQPGPALEHLERTDPRDLTIEQRYELAADLEACSQWQPARKLYAAVAAVNRSFRDVEACLARLDEKMSKDPQQRFEEGLAASLPERFRSPRLAGQGGMGLVYRAHDSVTGSAVAIKVLNPLLANDVEHRRRFLREAQTLAVLDHPGVVRILDVGEQPVPYYAMEYLEGTTLADHLTRNGPFDSAGAASLGARIAECLRYCHEKGLIHRDIKPANIFLEDNGRVVLIDFGLVHVDTQTALTRTGAVMGTLSYMAPEQLGAAPVTLATDIYALGVTLYEMVTGRVPFQGDDVIGQVLTAAPPSPRTLVPALSPTLDATILKCLEKFPKRRFKDCAELERALAAG